VIFHWRQERREEKESNLDGFQSVKTFRPDPIGQLFQAFSACFGSPLTDRLPTVAAAVITGQLVSVLKECHDREKVRDKEARIPASLLSLASVWPKSQEP